MSDGVKASDKKKNRIREAMETVLKAFESNPEKVALAVFKGNGKPSDAWSFFNRLIMLVNNTVHLIAILIRLGFKEKRVLQRLAEW